MAEVKTEFLQEIVSILHKGLDSDKTYDAVFDLLEKTVPFDSATLYLYKKENDKLEVIYKQGENLVDLAGEFTFARCNGMSSWISKQKNPIILQSLVKSRAGKEGRYNSLVSMPLCAGEKLIGVLNLGHQKPDMYKRIEFKDYEIVSSQISLVMEKMLLRKQLQEQNTVLKKTLKKLKETQKSLIEKERLAAIGEIVVTINHEINNPLSSIIGLAEVLKYSFQTGNQKRVKEGLKAILQGAIRIRRVTEKLESISSSESEEYVGSIKMTKLP